MGSLNDLRHTYSRWTVKIIRKPCMKLHLNYKQGRNVSPINNTDLVLLIRAWLAFAGFVHWRVGQSHTHLVDCNRLMRTVY